MDQRDVIKQVLDFHKNTFNNGYNAMVMLQDQNEKILDGFLVQANWVPQDFKKVMNEWTSVYKKGRDEFKKTVDENFKRVEDYFALEDRPQGKAKQQ